MLIEVLMLDTGDWRVRRLVSIILSFSRHLSSTGANDLACP